MKVFEQHESEVRSYCRSFTTVFNKATNAVLRDKAGNTYIDFFAGAGSLNYGHNNPMMKQRLIDYLQQDGITHSLDMATEAKESFLLKFHKTILRPRKLDYKVMFPGPTGTNAVESAMKLARKATGRTEIICFTNAFHGMSLGSLAATGNQQKRDGAGVYLPYTTFMPYDGYFGEEVNTADYLEKMLADPGSGIAQPAAILLETLQGEGGLNCARKQWLRQIEQICRQRGILLIVDDVQMGCGRTGTFFSFEEAGIEPDIVCLSKSIGGYGLPLALTLVKPKYDLFQPGEHNGTFRGNNHAFIAAAAALEYWEDSNFSAQLTRKSAIIRHALEKMVRQIGPSHIRIKGKGMIQGLSFTEPELAGKLSEVAFQHGVIMETSGPHSEVAKLMPPLTIEPELLEEGLRIVETALAIVWREREEQARQANDRAVLKNR